MTHFIFIHGIRPKPRPDVLVESCRHFLGMSSGKSLATGQIHLAHWADLAGYEPVDDDRGAFRPFSFKERITLGGLGIAKAAVLDSVERHLAAILNKKQPPNEAEIVGLLSQTLVLLKDPLAAHVMKSFIHDVHHYFEGGIREPVKDRVREQFDQIPPGSKLALVSHSMGTVIAVDVLLSDRRKVDWLLTLGSPLGFNAVRAKLAFLPNEFDSLPALAPRWDNLFDPLDVVSLDSDVADDLPEAKPNDLQIRNEWVNSAGKRNHHGLYGFLGHPETGALMAAFLEE